MEPFLGRQVCRRLIFFKLFINEFVGVEGGGG